MKKLLILLIAALLLCRAPVASAYIDLAPTLGKLVRESQSISVVEVDKFSRDKGALILKTVEDLKGKADAPSRHQVTLAQGTVPRPILAWAEPGNRGILLVSSNTALVCMGKSWYQVNSSSDGWWRLGPERPDLPLAYCGTVSRLADAVKVMLGGKTAIITTVQHGAAEGASFDLALNRPNLAGLIRLQRIRASLQMPQMVMAVSASPAYVVGPGAAGEEEVPALIEKLASPDATVRTEAADDLRTLGPGAGGAKDALAKLLSDAALPVRLSASAALLRIEPETPAALAVLKDGLVGADPHQHRLAARAAGLAGPAAGSLTPQLASLLKDPDELTRLAALEAIATLGRSAAGAMAAVEELLDDPQAAPDAADALGRMGPAARPAQQRLARLLASPTPALRWAGVRAMSQIGGPESAPAVDFMIKVLRNNPSEVDGYNMMIYLGLIGPDAKSAIPAIQEAWIKQPALKSATFWAIEPEKRFPWMGGARGPMEGDALVFVYECYVNELGDRLQGAAGVLARKIMDGSAGELPQWAYRILAQAPGESIEVLSKGLGAADVVQRERAIVALGYMGPVAAPARESVAQTLGKAQSERERRLIKWCLRQIGEAGKSGH